MRCCSSFHIVAVAADDTPQQSGPMSPLKLREGGDIGLISGGIIIFLINFARYNIILSGMRWHTAINVWPTLYTQFPSIFLGRTGQQNPEEGIIVSWHINFKDRKTATLRIHP